MSIEERAGGVGRASMRKNLQPKEKTMTRKRLATFSFVAVLTASLAIATVADAVPEFGDTAPEVQLAEFEEMLHWARAELDAAEQLLAIQEQYEADLAALYDETEDHTVSGALRLARVAVYQTRSHMFEVEQIIADLEAAIAELEAELQPEDRNTPSTSDSNVDGNQWQGALSIGSGSSLPAISGASGPGLQIRSTGSMGSVPSVRDRPKTRVSVGTSSGTDHDALRSR